MAMNVALSNREAGIMEVLWEYGPSTVAEVRDRLDAELAYTTVLTMLRNLEAKDHVGHEEEGRAHRYFPKLKQQAVRKSAIRHLAAKLFKGSSDLLLTQLVSDRKLSDDQVRRIRAILNEKSGKGEA
jgi:predicted transcriptional regulator